MERLSKVLILTPFPPPCGGIGNWSLLIAEQGKVEMGDRVDYFDTNIKRKSRLAGGFLSLFLESFFGIVWQFLGLLWAIARRNVDVVHSCSSGGLSFYRDIFAGLICFVLGRRFVVHLHFGRLPDVLQGETLEKRAFDVLCKFVDVFIAIDKRTQDCLSTLPGISSVLIPNATNVSLGPESVVRSNVVVFAGWVVKTKGIEELLAAWDLIQPEGWRLEIIGPYEQAYMDDLRGRFRFRDVDVFGEVDHDFLISRFQRAKIMCLPSYTEGFPFVVIEAMASGCAVIATCVGAIPEVLSGDGGVLVPPRDSEALRLALIDLLFDGARVAELSSNAILTVERNFTLSNVYKQYRKAWGV